MGCGAHRVMAYELVVDYGSKTASGSGELGSCWGYSSALCDVVWAAQGVLGILGKSKRSFWEYWRGPGGASDFLPP